jgi:hypothetical protein
MNVTPDQLYDIDPRSCCVVPFSIEKDLAFSGSGDIDIPLPIPGGRRLQISDWKIVSGDTNAANVKLKKGSTDLTATIAKGTVANAIVRGGNLNLASAKLDKGDALKVNASAACAIHVSLTVFWTRS